MKKTTYSTPNIEWLEITNEDVISTSDPVELPWIPVNKSSEEPEM